MKLTITMIFIGCAVVAALMTVLMQFFAAKARKSWIMSFAQYFTGVLFVFSGFVKAVDPLGTAYKMEQYFNEFYYTFEGTWFSFLAPIFPFFNNYSIIFSVVMIVFEIVLGIMLILGMRAKLSGWLFLLLVGFFTFLTGFTYLTGYVPDGVNFFSFGSWSEYKASNMKVTDCGCFGDFIKLEPKTSFFKDLILLVPAIYFVFRYKDMHQFFTKKTRNIIVAVSTVLLLVYCWSNYVWDIPHADFRDFKIGTDVAAKKEMEDQAQAEVQVVEWIIKNKDTEEVLQLKTKEYFDNYTSTYSKDKGWEVLEQIKSEPSIKPSKISDFDIKDYENNDITYEYLEEEGYHFMIISHKSYSEPSTEMVTVQDTTFMYDTIQTVDNTPPQILKRVGEVTSREQEEVDHIWDNDYKGDFVDVIKPIADKAVADGHKVSIVFGGATKDMVEDFASETGISANFYQADDILLKTIVRSNPGIVLWKDGKIVYKWHKNKVPNYEDLKSEFLK